MTMRAIAAEAGVSRQHLYSHFDDLGSVIEAYAGEVFGMLLVSMGMGVTVPGRNPEHNAVMMLDLVVSLRPEQRQMMRLVHARAVVDGLERLTVAFETRMFTRWRSYEPWAHIPDGPLQTLLWAMAGIVLDIADGVDRGKMERSVADDAMRRLPTMLATTFGYT